VSHSYLDSLLSRRTLGVYAAGVVGAGAFLGAGTASAETTAEFYYDKARRLAGDDPVLLAILAALSRGFTPPAPAAPAPVKIFDNIAVLGVGFVSALAVLTSDGIVLIDSLNTPADAQNVIVPGLRALGADPATIRFVVVTHGHFDHFGGAQYLADTYGARVMMSPADWAYMASTTSPNQPRHDLDISDGQRLTVGDTTITLNYTPGHTPGTVSPIFPVRDKGRRHTAMLWGGTRPPDDLTNLRTYLSSVEIFAHRTRRADVDVEVLNHPFCDYGLERIQQLQNGARNPFVMGENRTQRFMDVMDNMVRGHIITAGG
jgi:metallo-beta-lactamase class B